MGEANMIARWATWSSAIDDSTPSAECKWHIEGVRWASDGEPCDVRVIKLQSADDVAAFTAYFEKEPVPTLILPTSCATAQLAANLARHWDDVAGQDESFESIKSRLFRLVLRSIEIKEHRDRWVKDSLTGLLNRRAWLESVEASFATLRPEAHADLLLVDVDHFKAINDMHGHSVGDSVLIEVAQRLQAVICPADKLGRFGGEEFVVFAERDSAKELESLGEALRTVIDGQPMRNESGALELTVRVSIGVTRVVRGTSLPECMEEADRALYAAKAAGRNRVVTFNQISDQAERQDTDVELLHYQNVSRVVSERAMNLVMLFGKGLVQKAKRLAQVDRLTQTWNRAYFDRRIDREIELYRKDGRALSIAIVDLDFFGQFNKAYGLPTGDAVLRRFCEVAGSCIRPVDWLARYGGEEFVIVIPGSASDAAMVAERVRSEIESTQTLLRDGRNVNITVSVGVATFEACMPDSVALIQRASEALQVAKQTGRNRVALA